MRRKSFDDMDCSVAGTLDLVGDPWTLLIVRDLLSGLTRFDLLLDNLGISRNTLASRLESLCEHELVQRSEYQSNPPRFDYRLTEKGWELRFVIISLMKWGDQWCAEGDPPVEIFEKGTNRILDPVLVDRTTGVPLSDLSFRTRSTRTEA